MHFCRRFTNHYPGPNAVISDTVKMADRCFFKWVPP